MAKQYPNAIDSSFLSVHVIHIDNNILRYIPMSASDLPLSFNANTFIAFVKISMSRSEAAKMLHKYKDPVFITSTNVKKESTTVTNRILRRLLEASRDASFSIFRTIIFLDIQDHPDWCVPFRKSGPVFDTSSFSRAIKAELGNCARDAAIFIETNISHVRVVHGEMIYKLAILE